MVQCGRSRNCEGWWRSTWDETQEVVSLQSRGWEHGTGICGQFSKENRELVRVFKYGSDTNKSMFLEDSSYGNMGDWL